jgi:hypothetical protein
MKMLKKARMLGSRCRSVVSVLADAESLVLDRVEKLEVRGSREKSEKR